MKTFMLMLCCLAASHAWRCTEAPRLYNAAQIDAGQGMVVARNSYYYPYFLSGTAWYRLGTVKLKHVTAGPAGIWGTGTSNRVYKYTAGNFTAVPGSLQQVDAGGDGQIVGVAPRNFYTYCLRSTYASFYKGTGSVSWSSLSRTMRYYSCSPNNVCWGVDTRSQVYVTQRVTPTTCGTYNWIRVSGISMKMVEISTDGSVFGLATNGRVYQRRGISSSRPQGLSWSYISMCMEIKHLSYDLGRLWVVTTSGLLMVCTH